MQDQSVDDQITRVTNELKSITRLLQAEIDALETIISKQFGRLPLPPPELRLHVGTRTTASNFLNQGWKSSKKVLSVFGEPTGPVLDWGCGSGRTLRWLFNLPRWREHYRGTDVDAEAIDWLRQRGLECVTVCNDKEISLPYADRSLDGVFSFSVLTHIHPENFRTWFAEIARVMRPGALAFLTFNGADFLHAPTLPFAKTADDFRRHGFAWFHKVGNYKSAAFASHEFVVEAAKGIFEVEKIAASDYGRMDALYVRPKA